MSKRLVETSKLVDKNKLYTLKDALELSKITAKAKFDETIEIHVRLGVDPKQSDQSVRGTVTYPMVSGKPEKLR